MRHRVASVLSAVAEQGLYGLTNFMLIVLLAQRVSSDDMGRYSILLLIMQIGTHVGRGSAGGVLLASRSGTVEQPDETSGALSIATAIGIVVAVVVLVAGRALGVEVRVAAAWAVGGFTLIVQDVLRHDRFGARDFGSAACGAWAWIVVMAAAWFALGAIDVSAESAAPAAWASGALVSIAVIAHRRRGPALRIGPATALRLLRRQKSLVHTLLVEQIIGNGVALFGLGIVAAVLPFDELGKVRIAQAAIGPLAIFLQAAASFTTAGASKLDLGDHQRELSRMMWWTNVSMFGLGLAWLVALWGMPSFVGDALFGSTWDSAQPLALWMALMTAVYGLSVGTVAVAAGLNVAGPMRERRIATTAVFVVAQTVGAWVFGARGFVIAGAGSAVVGFVVWMIFGRSVINDRVSSLRTRSRVVTAR